MIRPTFCAVYREVNLERCKKCHQAAEMDALAAGIPEEKRMAKERVKVVAPCRICGREMEVAGRGLCGRCYGRVTRAINSGLTEAEAEEKLMAFLEEVCELPEQQAERACSSIVEREGCAAPTEAQANDEDFLDSVDAGKREPVTEVTVDGWGVEPVAPEPFAERPTAEVGDSPVAIDIPPRQRLSPPSWQEWQLMRCEELARCIHRALERRLEGVTEPQEITEAGEWLMELTNSFNQLEVK